MMEIRKIDLSNASVYEALWLSCSSANLFCKLDWLKLVCDQNQQILLFGIFEKNNLIGGFPIIHLNSRFLNYYSLPFLTPHTGFFIRDEHQNISKKRMVYELFVNYIDTLNADNFYMAFPVVERDFVPFKKKGFDIDIHLTYVIDLEKEKDEIFSNLKMDKKRNIKAAEKEGVRVSFESSPEIITALIQKTYNRQNKENLWINCANKLVCDFENGFQVTSYVNGKPASSIFIAYDKERAYYLFGGYDEELQNFNAGPMAMWSAIIKAKEMGLKKFDFEGSEIKPIEKYFQRFGGKQEIYFSVQKASRKQKLVKLIK